MPAISSGAIKGGGKLIAQLSSLLGMDKEEALMAGADEIMPYMQSITAVDTGELRDSESAKAEGGAVYLIAEADHASYIEFGTIKMAAQPFMRPAIDARRKQAIKAIVNNLKSQFRRRIGMTR